jgi:uncharacterized phosphosugar-binding protein
MNKAVEYLQTAIALAQCTASEQEENIIKAAQASAAALSNGGTIFTFGTGHSHLLAEEIFYRAGGLVKVYPIQDEPLMLHSAAARSSQMERLPGYARLLLDDIPCIQQGDILFIFANSGRNTVSVEMALCGKEKGMTTIGVTSLKHSKSVTSRHSDGRRLFEVCDIVIDNGGIPGDACVDINGHICGPTSTMVGAMIMQAVVCGTVDILMQKNANPEVFVSSNIDGGDEINQKYIDKYKTQIRAL